MSKLGRRGRRSRLKCERLEKRLMLDGNVLAAVVAGDLVIKGDDLGNGIQVRPGADGAYLVEGLYQSGDYTTVNGEDYVELTGVTDDVRIYMKGGDDFVQVGSEYYPYDDGPETLVVPDDLYILTYAGNDEVLVGNYVDVGGDVRVYTMAGDDWVSVFDTTIGDDLYVRTYSGRGMVGVWDVGIGDDAVILTGSQRDLVELGGVTVGDDLFVYTFGGDDSPEEVPLNGPKSESPPEDGGVYLWEMTVKDDTKIITGSGNDEVGIWGATFGDDLRIYGGSGDDFLGIAWSEIGDDAYLLSHGGADTIGLTSTTIQDNLRVDSGSGNDVVGLGPYCQWESGTGVTAKDGKVITGSGDDTLGIAISTFNDDLRVYTGAGHDTIGIAGTVVKDRFYLDSGSGNDLIGIAASPGKYKAPNGENGGFLEGMWECVQTDFGLMAKYATIYTRSGNDTAAVNDSVIEKYLKVYMSSGEDELTVNHSTVNKKAYFNGGSGKDAIYAHDNYFKRLSVRRFEVEDIT